MFTWNPLRLDHKEDNLHERMAEHEHIDLVYARIPLTNIINLLLLSADNTLFNDLK